MSYLRFLLFILAVSLSGCINNLEDLSSDNTIDPNKISYSNNIQPIFNNSCGGSGCHITNSQNGVNLSTYSKVMNSVGSVYGTEIILAGSPNESPLVDKIEPNPDFGSRMPPNGQYLTPKEINQIRAWIQGGAKDN